MFYSQSIELFFFYILFLQMQDMHVSGSRSTTFEFNLAYLYRPLDL